MNDKLMSLLDTHLLGTLLLTDKIHFMFIREKLQLVKEYQLEM